MRNSTILLAFVIFVSGCVFPGNFFGQDVLKIHTTTTTDGVADILTISDITTIPRSPLLPEREVLLSFVVKNNDLIRSVRQVTIDLFDAPLFKDKKTGVICNAIFSSGRLQPCQANPDNTGRGGRCSISEDCPILPGAEEQALFSLITFSQDEIANVKQDTHLNFKVNYNFDSSLTYSLPVVNMEEIIKRQRAGQSTDIVISKTHSSGPAQIDVELLGAPYVLAESPATLVFKLRNTGSGTIKNSNIDGIVLGASLITSTRTFEELVSSIKNPNRQVEQGLVIFFPQEFDILEFPGEGELPDPHGNFPAGTFTCDRNQNKCWNIGDINIYRDESRVSMRFKIVLKEEIRKQMVAQDIPFRSFQINSLTAYNYELRDSIPMTINLFENV